MKKGAQIDKGPLRKYLKGATGAKQLEKKIHRRAMRLMAENPENDNPMYNRYAGWLL